MHLALAQALERKAAGQPGAHLAAGIAHHYLESGDQPKALVASVRAAEAAEVVHANGEAAALYSRALKLWDRVADAEELIGRDHVELLRSAAWTTGREHEPARAETYLRAALAELGDRDPERAADLLELVAREQFNQGRSADAGGDSPPRAGAAARRAESRPARSLLAGLAKELMLESRHDDAIEAAERGARGRPRDERHAWPSCARWTPPACRCSGSAATTTARSSCARPTSGLATRA